MTIQPTTAQFAAAKALAAAISDEIEAGGYPPLTSYERIVVRDRFAALIAERDAAREYVEALIRAFNRERDRCNEDC